MIPVTGSLQRSLICRSSRLSPAANVQNEAFTDVATGTLVNSGFLDGMSVAEAKEDDHEVA